MAATPPRFGSPPDWPSPAASSSSAEAASLALQEWIRQECIELTIIALGRLRLARVYLEFSMRALVFTIDDNYILPLKVLWHTLYQTNSLPPGMSIFILHESTLSAGGICDLRDFFEIYRINPTLLDLSRFVPPRLPLRYSDHVSRATFFRLYMASILPDAVEYAIYLDVDTIATRTLRPLLTADIGDMPVAAVDHLSLDDQLRLWGAGGGTYFNAGVLLANLKQWRTLNIERVFDQILQAQSHRLRWWDQDVLNIAFQNRWARIPIWYNVNHIVAKAISASAIASHSHLIHYTGSSKPWNQAQPSSLSLQWHQSLAELCDYADPQTISSAQAIKVFASAHGSAPMIFESREKMISSLIGDDMVVAEIGVFTGEFSRALRSMASLRLLYLVDLFDGLTGSGDQHGNHYKQVSMSEIYDQLQEQYRDTDNVRLFKGASNLFFESLEDNSLDLAYIDGDHSYAGCSSDLAHAFSKVRPGGYITGHDYSFNPRKTSSVHSFGVKQAVDEFCYSRKQVIVAKAMDGCVSYAIRVIK